MQRVELQLEDDLTGGPADETVRFGVDGRAYEIDLSTRHATELRRQLAPFVEHAQRARARRHTGARTAATRERSRDIRIWAEQRGFAVAEHGRLPVNVIEEYERAHAGGRPSAAPGTRSAARRETARRRGAATRKADGKHMTGRRPRRGP